MMVKDIRVEYRDVDYGNGVYSDVHRVPWYFAHCRNCGCEREVEFSTSYEERAWRRDQRILWWR